MRRATASSDTRALARNYLNEGVYILHGDQDDNVPVEQARNMAKLLQEFHRDWVKFEQPGAGHWWGNPCVDWPAMFDFFARHRRPGPGELRHVEFTTVNPGVSADCYWVTIEAQVRAMRPSSADLSWDPVGSRLSGTTKNVARLRIDTAALGAAPPINVELDGQKLVCGAGPASARSDAPSPVDGLRLCLAGEGGAWQACGAPPPGQKGPHRCGPFKDAFRHRFLFVHGTGGSPAEAEWALDKARFDAEMWWYRANGSVDVVPDRRFDPVSARGRAVILFGNADTNSAWKTLLAASPVQVRSGHIRVGDHQASGDDLACLFLQPRADSDTACVAVIGGTGLRGMRLTDRLGWWQSGVAYPDCVVIGSAMLHRGWEGLLAAGFFGPDWRVETGEFGWNGM